MEILSILLSLVINFYPPRTFAPQASLFECNGEKLEATIYNNLNGSYSMVSPLEEIDAGGFVLLNWGNLKIMLPRTFNATENSFSDGKWRWSYEDPDPPRLGLLKSNGDIQDFTCAIKQS